MEENDLTAYKTLVSEISDLKEKIERYLHSGGKSIGDMDYRTAVGKLMTLRRKQTNFSKKVKEAYQNGN